MAESVSFGFDEHIDRAIATALRRRGVVVVTVQEAGRTELDDGGHLRWATESGLVFVTQDHDFEALHAGDQRHAGIVIVPGLAPIGHVIEWLELLAKAMTPAELVSQVIHVPRRPSI